MIQWLNVRAVCPIKDSMFEERTPSPSLSSFPLSLPIPLSPLSSLSSSTPPANPCLHLTRAGSRADVQTLSFRLGPHCQLSLVACPGSFFLLSPSSRGHRRPYKATFLLIHFCQFQQCHSNQCAGEWREAKLAVSLAARTVLFSLSSGDVSAATFLIEKHWVIIYFLFYLWLLCTGNDKGEASLVMKRREEK